jgi:D-lactate dehydrogenase
LKCPEMKVIAYSVKTFEKEVLAKANDKKHDITLISNALTIQTADYAKGKKAVLVFTSDDVCAVIINKLADLGIRYIATRSTGMHHIDQTAAKLKGIKLADAGSPSAHTLASETIIPKQASLNLEDLQQIAAQTIKNLDVWQAESN